MVAVDSAARTVEMELDHRVESLRPWVDIVLAPPRPRVMKRLLPQLAALGVGRIVLVGAKKVEKDFWGATLLKDENMRPLLVEGLMQSGTSILPVVELIDGETVSDFILGGSKITADGDCSHEIKRRILLGRKVMTNLDSILKSRDIILSTKVRLVKAMVFPVVMYGCESWTVKKAECRRIDAFECGDLSSPTRDRNCTHSLNHWTTREVPRD